MKPRAPAGAAWKDDFSLDAGDQALTRLLTAAAWARARQQRTTNDAGNRTGAVGKETTTGLGWPGRAGLGN
jgi:hypothetical protein